ncbi:hypothetical protein ACIQ1J_13740 [Streptomyces sp. NPDC097107]|uniref:hypothetical protein n=1 Tax=Streptomyces sp. NPDC097107 TaxID=3366089 RepID=UPI003830D4E0
MPDIELSAGLPGRLIGLACRTPGGVPLPARVLGLKPLRRLPVGSGALTKRPVPDAVADGRLRPLRTARPSGAASGTTPPTSAATNCWRRPGDRGGSTGPRSSSGRSRTS